MSRYQFGGTDAAWIMSAQDASVQYGAGALVARLSPGAVVRFYSVATGGTQYTGLLDAVGATVSTITADSTGALPVFSGPDAGPDFMWADANGGAGPRRMVGANDAASQAVQAHVDTTDPHGSKAYADAWHEIVVRYNTATSSWPTAASVPANPAVDWLWRGPVGVPPPIGPNHMREGDRYAEIPAS